VLINKHSRTSRQTPDINVINFERFFKKKKTIFSIQFKTGKTILSRHRRHRTTHIMEIRFNVQRNFYLICFYRVVVMKKKIIIL